MTRSRSGMIQEIHRLNRLEKPSARSLVAHIFAATLSGGMILLMGLGGAVIAYLRHQGTPTGDYVVLLAGAIIVWSFLRGCKAWQTDRNIYQYELAEARRSYEQHSC